MRQANQMVDALFPRLTTAFGRRAARQRKEEADGRAAAGVIVAMPGSLVAPRLWVC